MKAGKIKWLLGAGLAMAFVLHCAWLFWPRPDPRNVPRLVTGMELFDEGQAKGDAGRLQKALRSFEEICETDPRSYQAWHMKSLTEFHLLLLNQKDAEEYGRAAEQSAKKVTSLQDKFAEPYALLAALTAMNPAKRGPSAEVRRFEGLALMLGGNNPRVNYLIGIRYHLGRERLKNEKMAEELFLKASDLFEREPPGARAFSFPPWGHDRCLQYLGDICRARRETNKAADYYRRALAVNPFLTSATESLRKTGK